MPELGKKQRTTILADLEGRTENPQAVLEEAITRANRTNPSDEDFPGVVISQIERVLSDRAHHVARKS